MADALQTTVGVPPLVSGVVFATITGLVIIGGIRRIGSFTAGLVPIMSVFYVGSIIVIMVIFYREIPAAFSLIFRSAFAGTAALGGICRCRGGNACLALRCFQGGVFTNEAGLGGVPPSPMRRRLPIIRPDRDYGGDYRGCHRYAYHLHLTALALLITGGAWTSGLEGAS